MGAQRRAAALVEKVASRARRPEGITGKARHGQGANLRIGPRSALLAPVQLNLDLVGAWLSTVKSEVGFAQIGAFDGEANDPVHGLVRKFGWRGVLVEPQPSAFARLQANYAEVEGLTFLNAAVDVKRGTRTLWHLREEHPEDPWWVPQSASFDRAHLLSHIRTHPELAHRVVGSEVETLTLADVLARSPRQPVDVLQVDAEGYDAKIIAMLDELDAVPTVVRFEHRHLSPEDHSLAVDRLARRGYRFAVGIDDTLALIYEPSAGSTAIR